MKKTVIKTIALAFLVLPFACVKDPGNYRYNSIDEYSVDFNLKEGGYEWIDYSFPVVRIQRVRAFSGQELNIEPIIRHNERRNILLTDTSLYEFSWKAWNTQVSNPDVNRTIGKNKNLNYTVDLQIGSASFVRYRVTNKKTGVFFEQKFLLEVIDGLTSGMLVLSEIDGRTRLQMVANVVGERVFMNDVLVVADSELPDYVRAGKPIGLRRWDNDIFSPSRISFYILTTTGSHRLAWEPYRETNSDGEQVLVNSFAWKPGWRIANHFTAPVFVPENFVADDMLVNRAYILLAGAGNMYLTRITQRQHWGSPNNRIGSAGAVYKTSPMMAGSMWDATGFIIFEERSKSFRQISSGDPEFSEEIPNHERNQGRTWENTGMDLVALTTHSVGTPVFVYGIMKAQNPTRHVAFRAENIGMIQNPWRDPMPNIVQGTEEVLDLDQAKHWTTGGPHKAHIYFVIGAKVYIYHILDNIIRLGVDLGNVEITHLSFYKTGAGNNITIGTFENGYGRLSRYSIPTERETFVETDWGYGYPFAQFGRIVDIMMRNE
jgi:hypothetical protein